MKKAYYYLFYKFYKFSKIGPSIFPNDWIAGVAIVLIEVYCFSALLLYYKIFVDRTVVFKLSSIGIFVPLIGICVLNYMAFIHDNTWQKYVHDFDKLPRRRNIIGTWFVIIILVILFVSVIASFNYYSEVMKSREVFHNGGSF
jgi:uncharacterized membrane protein YidH (DUF202 family)